MLKNYYSDRNKGERARLHEEIEYNVWRGIQAHINTLIDKGAFGNEFPDNCPDGHGSSGTNRQTFIASLNAEIPDIDWPIGDDNMPETLTILDLIEFCYWTVAKPIEDARYYHSFFNHYHLSFDVEQGKADFREQINRMFARNGLVYEMKESGEVERIGPPVLREALNTATFSTGDAKLDELLETARGKYHSPYPVVRMESLEKLWDAWERLKTIEPGDKSASVKVVLDKVATLPKFRQLLEDEAKALTNAGNNLMIRHMEIGKEHIASSEQVDYLFSRLYAMIHLILTSRGAI